MNSAIGIRLFTLFSLILLDISFCHAQVPGLKFERISTDDGLSDNYVTCIRKDNRGFIWIGTTYGLNRYDGKHFKTYYHSITDTNSISNNYIYSIYPDTDGLIWIATQNGLNCFNPTTGIFKKYFHVASNPNSISADFLHGITKDRNGNFWIASPNGLNELSAETKMFRTFRFSPDDSLSISSDQTYCPFIDHLGRLWIGSNWGLNLYDESTEHFRHFLNNSPAASMHSYIITGIAEDSAGILWLTTWGEGLLSLDPKTGEYHQYWERPQVKHRGDHNILHKVMQDPHDANLFYIASQEKGFCFFNKVKKEFSSYHEQSSNSNPHVAHTLFNDREGTLWIGAENGLFKLDIRPKPFQSFPINLFDNEDCLSAITAIYQDKKDSAGNTLWAGTWSCGLLKLNLKSKSIQVVREGLQKPGENVSISISKIFRDSHGVLWVGTHEKGLLRIDDDGKILACYSLNDNDSTSISSNWVQDIAEDNQQRIWIATVDGLNLYQPRSHSFSRFYSHLPSSTVIHPYLKESDFKNILFDSSGRLLLGVNESTIFAFDPDSKKFSDFFSARLNLFRQADQLEDFVVSGKKIWCATRFGLLSIQDSLSHFIIDTFTTSDGLPTDFLLALDEDDCGNLWIGTGKGLVEFNKKTQTFKQFFTDDGLLNSKSGELELHKGFTGTIFLSTEENASSGGINFFSPCNFLQDTSAKKIVLTGFRIFNREVDRIKDFTSLKKLELSYRDRMITFEFAALDYIHPERIQYAYKLEGFDKDWVYCGNKTDATYTNLNGGKYTFRVKATNASGIWYEQKDGIKISVSTPFYEAWWFYFLCVVFVAAVLYAIYRVRINQLNRLAAVRAKIARDLHDDLGSRLSSISIISQNARDKSTGEIELFTTLTSASQEAMELMSDIIWSVNPENDKLENLLVRMREFAADILEPKNITFSIEVPDELQQLQLPMKSRKDFYLIYKEAINNAAKYSECKNVIIKIEKRNQQLALTIEDDGIGFDMKENFSGNGLKNMQSRAKTIGAALTILSHLSEGTKIQLILPIVA